MTQVRRTRYLFFYLQDGTFLDIPLLLEGIITRTPAKYIFALSILREEEYPISKDQLHVLFEVPSDKWTPVSEITKKCSIDLELLHTFAQKGFIVSDEANEDFAELKRRDEQLSSAQWNVYSGLYHFMTKWRNMDVHMPDDLQSLVATEAQREDSFQKFVDQYGQPPDPFYSVPHSLRVHELPLVRRENALYHALSKRKTTRVFDRHAPMTLEELSILLYYVYGCHGYTSLLPGIVAIKKTSPSGGGLHPTEVYPLISNVRGVNPGLYHYNVKNHSLELINSMTQSEAGELANEFTAGQSYPRWAHALFIMTTRFYRNFWKYREHEKAYNVLFMDAAHLSQTFYLICADLGLGAFITSAINTSYIEERLEVDGFAEGAIAICGCGKLVEDNQLDPQFLPYTPRETIL